MMRWFGRIVSAISDGRVISGMRRRYIAYILQKRRLSALYEHRLRRRIDRQMLMTQRRVGSDQAEAASLCRAHWHVQETITLQRRGGAACHPESAVPWGSEFSVGPYLVVCERLGSGRCLRRSDLQRCGARRHYHREHLGDDAGFAQFECLGFHDCARVTIDRRSLFSVDRPT